ncbi:hypothetical protein [Pedobacter cryoconitis]|uniref:Uncharacterized protein n=1 Tax=Pedobacter cryoconitis TaxID=188932 RepID=A0A327T844_9SPHI|nr:hypothetical protein [Pedobacter cryoconitis]RAJ37082.1 hypothetical protein LY11_00157 [Pedobacter cryoconitis]
MRIEIEVPVTGVYIADFDQIAAPAFLEESEDGVKLSFLGIEALKSYQAELLVEDEAAGFEGRNEIRAKIKKELKKAISENLAIMDSIRNYAEALFTFVYDREGHREDKKQILNNLIENIGFTENGLDLEEAVKESTYELGPLVLSYKLTFKNYSFNTLDFDFQAIKGQLVADLENLRDAFIANTKKAKTDIK